jgi:hypothetical protein
VSRDRARRHARAIIGHYLMRGGARLVVRSAGGRWGHRKGWHSQIGQEIRAELDHALDRHYTFWRRAYVLDAMEPGVRYTSKELRTLSGVNKSQVKRTLKELRNEGVVDVVDDRYYVRVDA